MVGLGGGVALDAAKFVALKKGRPIVVVPTVTSTGAIIHGFFARWEGRKIIGSVGEWPWIDFADIIVDYDVVLKAPVHLNTAGLGDVLCGYSGIAEWRRNAASGCGPAFDEEATAPALANFDGIVAGFPATLTEGGNLTPASIDLIVTAIQERDDLTLRHAAAPMADHPFAIVIEEANDTGWVHGELVALGAQCVVWLCEGGRVVGVPFMAGRVHGTPPTDRDRPHCGAAPAGPVGGRGCPVQRSLPRGNRICAGYRSPSRSSLRRPMELPPRLTCDS